MLIAQITVRHLCFDSGGEFEDSAKSLRLEAKTLNQQNFSGNNNIH